MTEATDRPPRIKRQASTLLFLATLLMPANACAEQTQEAVVALIHSLGCKGCHTIGLKGGTTAPALSNRVQPLTEAEISARLTAGYQGDHAFMPAYTWLTGAQRQDIARYLIKLEQ